MTFRECRNATTGMSGRLGLIVEVGQWPQNENLCFYTGNVKNPMKGDYRG